MGRRRKEIRPQPPRYYVYVFKNIVMDLPNFDAEIFRECTGIKI